MPYSPSGSCDLAKALATARPSCPPANDTKGKVLLEDIQLYPARRLRIHVLFFAGRQTVHGVEIAGEGRLEPQGGRKTVGRGLIVHVWIAIDPDRFIKSLDKGLVLLLLPLPAHSLRMIDYVSQTQHGSGGIGIFQILQNRAQFLQSAARHIVHDKEVGVEMGQGCPNHLGPQIDQGIGFYKKGAGRVVPVPILVVGGQGQTVDALWNAECARLVDAGNEQHLGSQRRLSQGPGDKLVAADVAKAHGVVGIQDDFHDPFSR